MSSFLSDFIDHYWAAMSKFLDSEAQLEGDNYTSGENSEEDDEVSYLIDGSFEDDYDPTLYYRYQQC